jgi:putative aldouronate transport system permease protein
MNAFYVIMMRSYFTANIPDSLIEAARIDGAGEYLILFRIVLPLSAPMLASLALMVGIGYWNDWMNGLYYLTDPKLFSIQNVLNKMITDIRFLQTNANQVTSAINVSMLPSAGIRMAIAVIGAVPVLLVYPFFQRQFVKGIVVGGIKG